MPNTWSADEIRKSIRNSARSGKLKAILLVGDAEPAAEGNPGVRARCVPAHRAKAKVNVKFGSEPEIGTDNWYADLDDDEVPDLAIGRLPVDTSKELTRVVDKILAYEKTQNHGLWRQRVNFVAGVGGFGGVLDGAIETSTKKLLTDGIPPAYQTNMTFGSWRSAFCPDPRRFHETAVARHNEGCLFWVYIGHGQPTGLDRVQVPGSQFHIFNCDDCNKLQAENGSPIAIMLACYTAAYDRGEDCLAEEMLRSPGGPVAVYGGSRVTMPYAMAVMSSEMLDEYFKHKPATLGEAILHTKRNMVMVLDEKTLPQRPEPDSARRHGEHPQPRPGHACPGTAGASPPLQPDGGPQPQARLSAGSEAGTAWRADAGGQIGTDRGISDRRQCHDRAPLAARFSQSESPSPRPLRSFQCRPRHLAGSLRAGQRSDLAPQGTGGSGQRRRPRKVHRTIS